MTIQAVKNEHLLPIISISNICFGYGYINELQLKSKFKNSWKGFVAIQNNQLIGFCIIDISQINFDEKYYDDIEMLDKPISVIKSIAVLPEFQHKGHGSLLFDAAINFLVNNSFKSVLYPLWHENNSLHFNKKIEKKGFKAVKLYKNYWKKASIKENFSCIRCGHPPCTCSLWLYKYYL